MCLLFSFTQSQTGAYSWSELQAISMCLDPVVMVTCPLFFQVMHTSVGDLIWFHEVLFIFICLSLSINIRILFWKMSSSLLVVGCGAYYTGFCNNSWQFERAAQSQSQSHFDPYFMISRCLICVAIHGRWWRWVPIMHQHSLLIFLDDASSVALQFWVWCDWGLWS